MKKRILALLLSLVLILPMLPVPAHAATSGKCGPNVTWEFNSSNGTLYIDGRGAMYDYDPEPYQYSTYAPWYNLSKKITRIYIYDGVTRVGDFTFWTCHKVDEVRFPDTLTSIGMYAFTSNGYDTEYLGVTLPASLARIEYGAFWGRELFYVEFLGSEPYIAEAAFRDTSPTFYIPCYRNWSTSTLNSLPGSWKYSHNTTKEQIPATCTEEGYTTETCPCGYTRDYNKVPATGHDWDDGMITKEPTETAEGVRTFNCRNCTATRTEAIPMLEVHIHTYQATVTPPTCTEKGYTTYICSGCVDAYKDDEVPATGHDWDDGEVTLEPTVTTEGVFTYTCTVCWETRTEAIPALPANICGNNATWAVENGILTVTGSGAMFDYSRTAPAPWAELDITSAVIGEGITRVGDYAFYGCGNLGSIDLPDSLTATGMYAFGKCTALTSAVIPGSVRTLGPFAFAGCDRLTSVELRDGMTVISQNAFAACVSLTDVSLPATMETIADCVFYNCDRLATVVIPENVHTIGDSVFDCTTDGGNFGALPYGGSLMEVTFLGNAPTDFNPNAFGTATPKVNYYSSRNWPVSVMAQFPQLQWCDLSAPPATEPPATEPPATESPVVLPTITGTYTTDLVMPAADLGVSAPDAVLRATLTFTEDGQASATWEAVDLTAFKVFFHDMFVNAYYAMAYGAGITDINEIEAFCQQSTGMSVSDYMYTIVTDEAMKASFTPASTRGTYRYASENKAIFTDLALMDVSSDDSVPNSFTVEDGRMYLNAASWGKADYTFVCTAK